MWGGGGGCVPRQLIPIICFALFHHSCEIKSGSGWEVGTRYGHFKSKMQLTQNASVDKMEETEVLEEIILDGCAREEDAARGSQLGQSRVRLVLTVLQAMALHTDRQKVSPDEYIS